MGMNFPIDSFNFWKLENYLKTIYTSIPIYISIPCCGVLLQKPEKKESWFQQARNELERWEVEEKKGKTWAQFKKEFEERQERQEMEERLTDGKEMEERRSYGKEMEERRTDGKGVYLADKIKDLADKIKNQFQTRLPRFSRLFFSIRDGTADLLTDFMAMVPLYYNLWRGKKDMQDFNLRELELLYEVYLQIKRMIPVFFFAILPLGNIILFTAAYLDINLPEGDDSELVSKFRELLLSIQDGEVPNPSEFASFRDLFSGDQTFAMEEVSSSHLDNLLTLHGQRGFFMKTNWLDEWASYIHLVDRFIKRNGGVTALSSEQLAKYCFQRGANANAMTDEEMQDYLGQWMAFSENISSHYIPLLLHAPALIGFNHKSNQSVIDQGDDSLL